MLLFLQLHAHRIFHYLRLEVFEGKKRNVFSICDFLALSFIIENMSSLKIPDLNLFRGKRGNRENLTTMLQEKGMKLISRGKGKASIDEMQAELYLDNFKANLQHFVSPTKYKDQAQKYLKTNKGNDEMYLKALQFPSSKRYCSNCFDQYMKTNRQCYCQIEHRVPQMYRHKETINYYQNNKKKEELIVQQRKEVIPIKRQQAQSERGEETISHDFILTESEEIPQKQDISYQLQNDRPETKSIVITLNKRIIPDSTYFYENLRKRQNQLDNLNMSIDDSRAIEVDFQGLNEARKEYINKSNQILSRLDEIIRSHSP